MITALSLFMFYSNPSKSVILLDILSWLSLYHFVL